MSGIAFSGYETFRYEQYHHVKGRFADAQESRFHGTKRSNMCSSVEQWDQFTDAQEWLFEPSKRSNMGIAFLVGGRFDDIR